jgi:hypothetical protein
MAIRRPPRRSGSVAATLGAVLLLGIFTWGAYDSTWTSASRAAQQVCPTFLRNGPGGAAAAAVDCPGPALASSLVDAGWLQGLLTDGDNGTSSMVVQHVHARKPKLTPQITRMCEGTVGDWCTGYHLQTPVPAVTAPRGNQSCSLDCNQARRGGAAPAEPAEQPVGVCGACRALCKWNPAHGWTTTFNPDALPAGRRVLRAHRPLHLPRGVERLELPAPHEAVLHPQVPLPWVRGTAGAAALGSRDGAGLHVVVPHQSLRGCVKPWDAPAGRAHGWGAAQCRWLLRRAGLLDLTMLGSRPQITHVPPCTPLACPSRDVRRGRCCLLLPGAHPLWQGARPGGCAAR